MTKKEEVKLEKEKSKSIFMPLSTYSVGKSFFMKQIVYGLEKHGYSVGKYEGNPEHGDFIKSYEDSTELIFDGFQFFDLFGNDFDSICLDLPVNFTDKLFSSTNQSIEKSSIEDYHRFLKITLKQKRKLFFVIPLGNDIIKTEATLDSIYSKTNEYQDKNGEKINLIIIKNKGLWKTTGIKDELDAKYNNLPVLELLKQNPLFNVIYFTANENFACIKDQVKKSTIENIVDNDYVKSHSLLREVAEEIQEEAERLYQTYSPFL